jgi:selenide,water dikinase
MSDLYAVGVEPYAALAIAVWPRDPAVEPALHEAMEALIEACRKVGCIMIGGHTAYADQPLLGLCVIGEQNQISKKEPVRSGDLLYLTKPLGSGIAVSAIKEGVCSDRTEKHAVAVMRELNKLGIQLNHNPLVKIATDITGYGLCGQLLRLSESTGQNIILNAGRIPIIDGVMQLAEHAQGTQSAERNWGELKNSLDCTDWLTSLVVCDPQTNGPILFVADASFANELRRSQEQFFLVGELAGPSHTASQKQITIR